ncbi:MAG: DNA polymerase/3'-5' exonuclease PolX [Gemmataceae bacterium]
MTNAEIATAMDEIGTLLALKGENDFRCRAYTSAARSISQFGESVSTLVKADRLNEVPGVGATLRDKLTTLVTTGKLPFLEELRAATPPGLLDMLRLPGIGPKKVKALYDSLKLDTIDKLKASCESGEVAKLKGFGEKTQQKILEGIAFLGTVGNRVRIDLALPLGEALLARVKAMPGVVRAELCGSVRRRRETSKDIDIVASSDDAAPIMAAFVAMPEVMQIVGHGETKSSVVAQMMVDGERVVLNADLRVVSDEQFLNIAYLTGSKEHNIRMRQRAIDRGLSLNEYGLTGPKGNVKAKSEAEIYKALDLEYVPPELREDTGEIAAAEANQLPKLVEVGDIRGVFHNHSTYSDGKATLEQMARTAQSLGLEYFGIGDHSQVLALANGLSPDRVRKQWAEIDELNAKFKGFTILKGTECDILQDGSMDYDDELLAGFDYVVASVHSFFNLPEEEQTNRICKALTNKYVTMLGHATGRLLLRRDGYKVDLERVIQTAAKHGKMIEINAQPDRLDLDWTYVKRAKSLGVPLVINPDAHAAEELQLYSYGVHVARRGWLTKDDVFNTKPLSEVMKVLKKMKGEK